MTFVSVLVTVATFSVAGVLASGLLSLLPGFHVYNLVAIGVVLGGGHVLPPEWILPVTMGMVVGFSVFSAIPSVLLAAPDESAFFTVLPGQRMLMEGRGAEAVLFIGAGSMIGLAALCGSAAILPAAVPVAHAVLSRHAYWIVWCVIAFMLLSEWPRANAYWVGPAVRLAGAWRQLAAGLLTFVLSGVLGLVLMNASPIDPRAAFQNLMPAFVGLFTLPWLLMNLVTRVQAPPQEALGDIRLDRRAVGVGGAAGVLGGGFAAFMPGVTGGVGGMLAGHALAVRDGRAFLISQGASRTVYMAGALLLFFLPDGALTRGGAAAMLPALHAAAWKSGYAAAVAGVAFSAAAALLLIRPLTRVAMALLAAVGCRVLSWIALVAALVLVLTLTGIAGLVVTVVATAIGLVPLLHGSRRMNALGVILLPLAINLSGLGPDVARWLGLR